MLQASARETTRTRQHSALLSSRPLGLGNHGRDVLRVWTRHPLGVVELALAWRTDCQGNRLAMEVEAADVRALPFVAMFQTPSLSCQPTGGNQFTEFLDIAHIGKMVHNVTSKIMSPRRVAAAHQCPDLRPALVGLEAQFAIHPTSQPVIPSNHQNLCKRTILQKTKRFRN